jgi:hypothetical protein
MVVRPFSASVRLPRGRASRELARGLLFALLLVSGCTGFLDTAPIGVTPESSAIVDAAGARAASAGSYTVLQSGSSYGEELVEVGDIASDNVDVNNFDAEIVDAHRHRLTARSRVAEDFWKNAYDGINRVNEIIAKVPSVTPMTDSEKAEIVGEAYFLRALEYHNLVKYFGGVPLKLLPTVDVHDLGNVTRASAPEVYAQILMDLDSAAADIFQLQPATRATVGAVLALRARVLLYDGDWAGAEVAAASVEHLGYSLAPSYADLFKSAGDATSEDIFRVDATAIQSSALSFDYGIPGAIEPTVGLLHAFDDALDIGDINSFVTSDARGQWSISVADGIAFGTKFRSTGGTEKFHVIRFAEVVLIRAEALARLNRLTDAVSELHRVQARANAPLFVLGAHAQQDVIDAITAERRKELAFEGDRWPDLVRLGTAVAVLGIDPTQTLYPIPEADILHAPTLIQNPGY